MSTSVESPELRSSICRFYRNPSSELIADLLANDLANGFDVDKLQSVGGIYFYIRAIQEYPDVKAQFGTLSQADGKRGELAKRLLNLSTSPDLPDVHTVDIDAAVLDMLWSEYSVTGSTSAIRRVISVLDWDDIVRARLNAWLQQGSPKLFGRKQYEATCRLLHKCVFPIDFQRRVIDESVDLDLHVAAAFQNGHLKAKQLPIVLSADEWEALGTKSAAIWSLRSLSSEDPVIAAICEEEAERRGGAGRLLLASEEQSEL